MARGVYVSYKNCRPGFEIQVWFHGQASNKEVRAVFSAASKVFGNYESVLVLGKRARLESANNEGTHVVVDVFVKASPPSTAAYVTDFLQAYRCFRDDELPPRLNQLGEYNIHRGVV